MAINSITIDGPAGAGKSTVAKIVADRLSYVYLDTGAMYRALTYLALENKLDLTDEDKLAKLAQELDFAFEWTPTGQKVIVNGEDLTTQIRTPEVSQLVSTVAKYPKVRQLLVACQQKIAAEKPSVLDGRDTGTWVLPQARHKFFLTASALKRAERRCQELLEKGYSVTVGQIQEEIEMRDREDQQREVAPLIAAEDAVWIDTSDLTIQQVVDSILEVVERGKG